MKEVGSNTYGHDNIKIIGGYHEHKKLRIGTESFEKFHERVLSSYTSAYIGFYMQLQAYMRTKNIEMNLDINCVLNTGKNEEFEIFELGRKLYYRFFGEEAYSMYNRFCNENPREKLKSLQNSGIDANMAVLIEKMIGNESRAAVFSELLGTIALAA